MITLLTGLILLPVCCCGVPQPFWGTSYQFRGYVRSLTNGLAENFLTFVSIKYGRQVIQIDISQHQKRVRAGDTVFVSRDDEHYDMIQRYFMPIPGNLKRDCVTYRQPRGFADSYRLPELTNTKLKYKFKSNYTVGDYRYEQWYRTEKVDKIVIIMESVWIRYNKEGEKEPISRNYKEYTLPSGTVSVHKIYRYRKYYTKAWSKENYDPKINKRWPIYSLPHKTIKCTETNVSHLIDGSSDQDTKEICDRIILVRDRALMVKEHNKSNLPYKIEINKFSRMTDEELHNYASCNRNSLIDLTELENVLAANTRCSGDPNVTLPESINWRLNGAVTPVKDQADCGSCWAFAVVGAMESFHYINSEEKELVMLSEQMLIDCVWNLNGTVKTGSRGCFGGKLEYGFQWITQFGGIQRTVDYGPYGGRQDTCGYMFKNMIKLKKFKFVESPINLEIALVENGPIAVFIQADLRFMFYKSGIYEWQEEEIFTNHVALLVGYGKHNGQNYWLIKNSWGRSWGEDGYIRIKYTRKSCGPIRYGFLPVQ